MQATTQEGSIFQPSHPWPPPQHSSLFVWVYAEFVCVCSASDNVSKSVFKLGYPWSLGVVRFVFFPRRPQALAPTFPPQPHDCHLARSSLPLSPSVFWSFFPLSLNAFDFTYRDRLSFCGGCLGRKTLAASGSGWLCGWCAGWRPLM